MPAVRCAAPSVPAAVLSNTGAVHVVLASEDTTEFGIPAEAAMTGAAIGSAALAGCSMAPKYVRPAAPVSPSFPTGAAYESVQLSEDGAGADIGWRDFYDDPLLHELVERRLRATATSV